MRQRRLKPAAASPPPFLLVADYFIDVFVLRFSMLFSATSRRGAVCRNMFACRFRRHYAMLDSFSLMDIAFED